MFLAGPSRTQVLPHILVWVLVSSPQHTVSCPAVSLHIASPNGIVLRHRTGPVWGQAWEGANPAITAGARAPPWSANEWRAGVREWVHTPERLPLPGYIIPLLNFPSLCPMNVGIGGPIVQMRKPRDREGMRAVPKLQPRGDIVGY